MERTDLKGKDVIVHKEMTPESREKELKQLKEESENLKEWEEQIPLIVNDQWYFYTMKGEQRFMKDEYYPFIIPCVTAVVTVLVVHVLLPL